MFIPKTTTPPPFSSRIYQKITNIITSTPPSTIPALLLSTYLTGVQEIHKNIPGLDDLLQGYEKIVTTATLSFLGTIGIQLFLKFKLAIIALKIMDYVFKTLHCLIVDIILQRIIIETVQDAVTLTKAALEYLPILSTLSLLAYKIYTGKITLENTKTLAISLYHTIPSLPPLPTLENILTFLSDNFKTIVTICSLNLGFSYFWNNITKKIGLSKILADLNYDFNNSKQLTDKYENSVNALRFKISLLSGAIGTTLFALTIANNNALYNSLELNEPLGYENTLAPLITTIAIAKTAYALGPILARTSISTINAYFQTLKYCAESILTLFKKLGNGIQNLLKSIYTLLCNVLNSLKTGVIMTTVLIYIGLSKIAEKITSLLKSLKTTVTQVGTWMLSQISSYAKSAWDTLVDYMTYLFHGIKIISNFAITYRFFLSSIFIATLITKPEYATYLNHDMNKLSQQLGLS